MDNLSLLDANKPEKVKDALNELIKYKNSAMEIPNITAESLGLGNVDNTKDVNKPLSTPQKNYIDAENAKNVKLESETVQKVKSDLELGEDKTLYAERGNGDLEPLISIVNSDGYENVEVGSANIPLKVFHSQKDINGAVVNKRPKITIQDDTGDFKEDNLALLSDVDGLEKGKVNNDVFADAETTDGVVTGVDCDNLKSADLDDASIRITVRSVKSGSVIKDEIIQIKLASNLSRGLMSKEDVAKLADLMTRVAAIEGKASRYLYTAKQNPTAKEIDDFAIKNGQSAPYSGVAIVVAGTYHVWHYYENDDIGWRDDGSDTVQQATNTTLGIVRGENEAGKVYVESNGTMSVVGFDELKSKTDTNSSEMITAVSIVSGTQNGTIKLIFSKNGEETSIDNIAITGLGSAAFTDSTNYATAEQGAKADKSIDETKANSLISAAIDAAREEISNEISQANTTVLDEVDKKITTAKEDVLGEVDTRIAAAIEESITDVMGGSY